MNKTRRRKKKSTDSRVTSVIKEAPKVTSPAKIRHAREQIEKHLNRAGELEAQSRDARKHGDYGEAAKLLNEASKTLHLANAEKRRLPDDAL